MSVRLLTHRLFRHGRWIVQNICKRDIHINILDQRVSKGAAAQRHQANATTLRKAGGTKCTEPAIRNAALFRFGQQARRLFVDNILNRVTTSYSADLRTEAAKKFFYGDSRPFFALVGVSLASGTGVLNKDDELEGVCWEIREAISRLQNKSNNESADFNEDIGLDNLNIGPPIAKGCAAVVYAASFKHQKDAEQSNAPTNLEHKPNRPEPMSPIQHTSRFLHNFGGSMDNIYFNRNDLFEMNSTVSSPVSSPINAMKSRPRMASITEEERQQGNPKCVRFDTTQNVSFDAAESSASSVMTNISMKPENDLLNTTDLDMYPLALKMMFNYDIQSNAMAILRAMYKETIPAQRKHFNKDAENWEKLLIEQSLTLPTHPNIVEMFGVFCAQIPNLLDSKYLYPMALPPRLNPDGYGRNMSLFLVMKRYNSNLRDYLAAHDTIPMRLRLLLFAQLLEATTHMYRYGVAHRDLKSDNILIDSSDEHCPILIVSDFGCCLADRAKGLLVPYTSMDIDKGGNTALMAPEIINQVPGTFSILNYTKSDLWACGAIAYEICDHPNPFYPPPAGAANNESGSRPKYLRNVNYNELDLPPLNGDVPPIVQKLIANLLQCNPKNRLNPDIAANVMQLFLWAPSAWLNPDYKPAANDLLQWLLSLTTKVLCDGRLAMANDNGVKDAFGFNATNRRTYTEYMLITSFLARAHLERIRCALDWIHNVI